MSANDFVSSVITHDASGFIPTMRNYSSRETFLHFDGHSIRHIPDTTARTLQPRDIMSSLATLHGYARYRPGHLNIASGEADGHHVQGCSIVN